MLLKCRLKKANIFLMGNSQENICKRSVRKKETLSSSEHLSPASIMRRAEDTSSDLLNKFRNKVKKKLESCCLTLGESNDPSDTAQIPSLFGVYASFDRSRTMSS